MRQITGQITEEIQAFIGDEPLDKADAYPVTTYRRLVFQVAKLAYLNKDICCSLEDRELITATGREHQRFIQPSTGAIICSRRKSPTALRFLRTRQKCFAKFLRKKKFRDIQN